MPATFPSCLRPWAAVAFLSVLSGCFLEDDRSPGPWTRKTQIIGFTSLADTGFAVVLRAWETRLLDNALDEWEHRSEEVRHLLVDRRSGAARTPAEGFPREAAPALPGLFYACEELTRVPYDPPVRLVPAGPCGTGIRHVSPGHRFIVAGRRDGGFTVLDSDFAVMGILPAQTGDWRLLGVDEAAGHLDMAEVGATGGGRWKRFSLPDLSPLDSAELENATVLRVSGIGARIVCGADSAGTPCWEPGPAGFRTLAQRHCPLWPCEWEPRSRRLIFRRDPFVFVEADPATGSEISLDFSAALSGDGGGKPAARTGSDAAVDRF